MPLLFLIIALDKYNYNIRSLILMLVRVHNDMDSIEVLNTLNKKNKGIGDKYE